MKWTKWNKERTLSHPKTTKEALKKENSERVKSVKQQLKRGSVIFKTLIIVKKS